MRPYKYNTLQVKWLCNLLFFCKESYPLCFFVIFRQLPVARVGKAIMLVVLAQVQADSFALGGDTHRNHLIGQPVKCIAHDKSVYAYNDYCQDMDEENFDISRYQPVYKYARHDGAEDTAYAVGGKYVEGIVYARMVFPVHGDVADHCSEECDEDTFAHRYVACRWGDGYQSYDCTDGGPHSRRLTSAQAVEENPYQHGGSGCRICIQEGFDGNAIRRQRGTGVEAEPAQP